MTGGIGRISAEQFWTEQVRLTPLTSDPNDSEEGELWLRADLAEEDDQLATLRLDTGGSTVDIPVFDLAADVPDDVSTQLRLVVDGQQGFVPTTADDAAIPQLGLWSDGVRYGAADGLRAIPDSVIDNLEPSDGDPAGPYDEGDDLSSFYSGTLDHFDRTTDDPTIEGDYSIHAESPDTLEARIVSVPDGQDKDLPNGYPDLSDGDRIRMSGDEIDTDATPGMVFEAVDEDNFYSVAFRPDRNWLRIRVWTDGSDDNAIVDDSPSMDNELHHLDIWRDGDDINYELFDSDMNSIHTGNVNDDTYKGNKGIGWYSETDDQAAVMDDLRWVDE